MTEQKLREFSKVIQEAKYELLVKLKEFNRDSLFEQSKEEMAESLLFRGQLDAFLHIEQMLADLRLEETTAESTDGAGDLRRELHALRDKVNAMDKAIEKLIIDSRRHEVDVMSFSSVGYSRRPLKRGSISSKLIKIMKKDPEAVYSVSRLIKENKGLNQSTLQSALRSLVRRGSIKKVQWGRYKLVEK